MFLWRACSNVLPTRENLHKRRVQVDSHCVICCQQLESVGHLLWECALARNVWALCQGGLQKCANSCCDFFLLFQMLVSLSITQPLQSNPIINIGYKRLNRITIKFGTELKPTKHIVVNHNFTTTVFELTLQPSSPFIVTQQSPSTIHHDSLPNHNAFNGGVWREICG